MVGFICKNYSQVPYNRRGAGIVGGLKILVYTNNRGAGIVGGLETHEQL